MHNSTSLSLHPDAEAQIQQSGLACLTLGTQNCNLSLESLGLRLALEKLTQSVCSPAELELTVCENSGVQALGKLDDMLSTLSDGGFLCRSAFDGAHILATLIPVTGEFEWQEIEVDPEFHYRLSRFAFVRRDQEGLFLDTPLVPARLKIKHSSALTLIFALEEGARPGDLSQRGCTLGTQGSLQLLRLLLAMKAVTPLQGDGLQEDSLVPCSWEFHDLLFHSRSRAGRRARQQYGRNNRFEQYVEEPPEVPGERFPGPLLNLPSPSPEKLAQDPPFSVLSQKRRSLRDFSGPPLTLEDVGEFLQRVARPQEVQVDGFPELAWLRPYASGGGAYEHDIFFIANRCDSLDPGLYYYLPATHQLQQVEADWEKLRGLLLVANTCMGKSFENPPQALFLLVTRFAKMTYPYQGIAYAAMLKNVGAIYQQMYLAATAMGLVPCANGLNNADLFAQASGLDYYREGLTGEFCLGKPNTPA